MREFYDGGYEKENSVVLGARRGRALLGVLGGNRIRAVKEVKSGRIIRFPYYFRYSLSGVVLHENDEITVYVRSLKRLWGLAAVYVLLTVAAVSADKLWEGAAGLYAQAQGLILREDAMTPKMAGIAENGSGQDEKNVNGGTDFSGTVFGLFEESAYEEKIPINSRKKGITFTNRDKDGVRFGYVVYADGVLFESVPCAWQDEAEYTLTLYERLAVGEHELLVNIYCYREESTDQFDILQRRIIIIVEE